MIPSLSNSRTLCLLWLLSGVLILAPSGAYAIGPTLLLYAKGELAGDSFGRSVAAAGDVNGDGFADVIVGAYLSDAAGSQAGRAYVLYGGNPFDEIPDLVLTGEQAGDNFGISVAGVGDFNGDGYDDVLVGAYQNDTSAKEAGRAYLYFGGSDPDETPDLVISGEAAGDKFGVCVAPAGDINGDEFDDVVIGAYRNGASGVRAGRAYVFFGGSVPDTTADMIVSGEQSGDYFGRACAGVGDVNGDGYGDLLVGAYGQDAGGNQSGRGYLYFGGASPDTAADVVMTGEAADDMFGYTVAAAGDVNEDGFDDFLIGAPRQDSGGQDAGRAYAYFGGSGMDADPDLVVTGIATGHELGYSLAGGININGQKSAAFLIGTFSTATGNVLVLNGGPSVDAVPDYTISGGTSEMFGSSLAMVGDLNGDGLGDVAVGAYLNCTDANFAGRVYFYRGTDESDVVLVGETSGDNFGWSVDQIGDADGDGHTDIVVGAFRNSAAGNYAGRAYVYRGGPDMDDQPDVVLTGEAAGDHYGFVVGGVGDTDGDHWPDVLVTAPDNASGGDAAGRVYLFRGGPAMDSVADLVLTGEASYDHFGYSASGAGDVNNDGYRDVVVGAYGNDGAGDLAGRVYLYLGGPGMDTTANMVLPGEIEGGWFGVSVAGVGDMNGDGFDDIAVGACGNGYAGVSPGRAFVFFGGAPMDSVADLVVTGEAPDDWFGIPVAPAGDWNHDGYADLVVGATGNDVGGYDAGRAYVYFGGAAPDTVVDVVMSGSGSNSAVGTAMAPAGDWNGDTFSDLLVGDPGIETVGLYFGGSAPDSLVDITIEGETGSGEFGTSVSAAGDVDNDGYDDVAIGNPKYGEGRVFIYYGRPAAAASPALAPEIRALQVAEARARVHHEPDAMARSGDVAVPTADPDEGLPILAAESVPDDVRWWDGFYGTRIGSTVRALTVYDGDLWVAGEFREAGGVPETQYVVRWNGSGWDSVNPDETVHSRSYCFMEYGGDLYLGSDGVGVGYVFRRWDGTEWHGVATQPYGDVYALAPYGDGFAVGGSFLQAGSVPIVSVARGEGRHLDPMGAGLYGGVRALVAFGDLLVAGGTFDTYADLSLNDLAAWDGTSWNRLGGGVSGTVRALVVQDDRLYVGGEFADIDGIPGTAYLAKWDGTAWSALGSGVNDIVTALYTDESQVIAGGTFSEAGGLPIAWTAIWDGSSWNAMNLGLDMYPYAFTAYGDLIVAGGVFYKADGKEAYKLAAWDGSEWSGEMSSVGGGISGSAAWIPYDGDLVVASNGGWAGDLLVYGLARWNGVYWSQFSEQPPIYPIRELGQLNGNLVVVGTSGAAAMWNGSVWTSMPDDSAPPVEFDAVLAHNDTLYAAGHTSPFGSPNYVKWWDGQDWVPLGDPLEYVESSDGVNCMAVYDGDLIVAGDFVSAGGVTLNSIARWNGSSWSPLGTGFAGKLPWGEPYVPHIRDMVVYGSELIVVGDFTEADGQPIRYIARWDGTVWSALGGGLGARVSGLGEFEGRLIAAGEFEGDPFNHVAAWDGSTWSALGSGLSGGSAVAVYDGSLYIASCRIAGGKPSIGIARWLGFTTSVPETPPVLTVRAHPNPASGPVTVPVRLSEAGSPVTAEHQVTANVYDLNGRLIRRIGAMPVTAAEASVVWDGKDERGVPTTGVYFLQPWVDGETRPAVKVVRLP